MDYQVVTDFELEQNESGWTITKYVGFDVENMEIPSEIDGKKITEIGNKAFKGANICNIKVGKGVQKIGKEAFSSEYIEEIIFPDTLVTIGGGAFKGCDDIKIIFESAFNQLSPDISDTYKDILIIPKTIEKIGEGAFSGCCFSKVIILPGCEFALEKGCFTGYKISDILIPATITKIHIGAIESIFSLDNMYCEAGTKAMEIAREEGVRCLSYSGNLNKIIEDVTITKAQIKKEQDEFKRIEQERLEKEQQLLQMEQERQKAKEQEAKRLEEEAKRKEAEKPYTLTSAVYDKHLVSFSADNKILTISKEVKVIKKSAFSVDKHIIQFEEGSQLEKIEKSAFYESFQALEYKYASSKGLKLPPSVKIVEKGAFKRCDDLKQLHVPSTCVVEEGFFEPRFNDKKCKIVYYNSSQDNNKSDSKANNNSGIMGKLKALFKK